MNNDEMDDAEFDAFLKGEGDLSARLQALAQPSPSAELDAAILARATVDAARAPRPAAANDAGAANAPTPHLGRLSWRWRVPAGIAATVLVGVVANQSWRANEAAQVEAMAVHEPPAEVAMVQPIQEKAAELPPAAVVVEAKPAPKVNAPAMAAPAAAGAVAQSPPPPPPQLDLMRPAPAPVVAAPEVDAELRDKKAAYAEKQSLDYTRSESKMKRESLEKSSNVMGGLKRDEAQQEQASTAQVQAQIQARAQYQPPAPVQSQTQTQVQAPAPAAVSPRSRFAGDTAIQPPSKGIAVVTAPMQLELIEAMLKSGMKREALEEWKRFRATYPDYPVSQATQDQIKAIKP